MGEITRKPRAIDDAISIWRYVATDSDHFADVLLDRIDQKLALLADGPLIGRARPELATDLRSYTVGNYVLYYRPTTNGIELVRILHGARDVNGQPFD